MPAPAAAASAEEELAAFMGELAENPLGFVCGAFEWGEGELAGWDGPDEWQRDYLRRLGEEVRGRRFDGRTAVAPVQMAVASGHGVGKSALVAWLILWIMSTRPNCKGVVTATTNTQLETKTWPELEKWWRRCLTRHWFDVAVGRGSLAIKAKAAPKQWFFSGQSCSKDNSEAFAGQHAADSSSVYIFDEASGVPDAIWDVSEGGLTDGEPFRLVFGNPTRGSGRFRDCFGRFKHRWATVHVDARTVAITNKDQIQQWLEDYGEDSDFFKVRVRGLFPSASSMQFFASEDITAAMKREVYGAIDDPVVIAVDVARFGADRSVIWMRRGFDCRNEPRRIYQGADTKTLANEVFAMAMAEQRRVGELPDAIFVDETGVGGGVVDDLRSRLPSGIVRGITFGARSDARVEDVRSWNKRAEIHARGREALRYACLPDDPELHDEMCAIEYGYARDQTSIQIEDKDDIRRRLGFSPDLTDAYCLLWANPVPNRAIKRKRMAQTSAAPGGDWFDDYRPGDS